ncbi:DUF3618 domain-containing protein [Nostocoides sp. Soil756]|jgi:hypothetical protein|uniref:DUF3618 domain-containing protein n=1 Tax=Nostocoides sp. Soil756 TaxID=1736399 RepID=UPI0006FE278F|nr:DUF3618 domain-containing protein [Tetrasphaera sp. Soil756]KRE62372.1 hypothetical protein ASG78_04845 [Tetrasphaera sp. Soil756]
MSQQQSIAALEAEVVARRERLARTVDQLVVTASPKNILRRQVEAAKAALDAATRTPDGRLRTDRVAAAGAVVAVVGGVLAYRAWQRR